MTKVKTGKALMQKTYQSYNLSGDILLVLQGLKNLLVRGPDLTFSNPVKTDGPVETVQLRT